MNASGRLALACALLCLAGRSAAALIEGVVELPEDAAPPMPRQHYAAGAAYTAGPPEPRAAIVFLEGSFPPPPPTAGAAVAQRQYQFAPGLLAVTRGSAVAFPNLDDEYHNVFSYSKTKRFDLGRYRKTEASPLITFDQAGVVRLFCEIHDHMRGTILVLDTPYFVKTGPDGRYRLDGVPAGRHVLKAWLDDDTVLAQPVELRDGDTLHVDFARP